MARIFAIRARRLGKDCKNVRCYQKSPPKVDYRMHDVRTMYMHSFRRCGKRTLSLCFFFGARHAQRMGGAFVGMRKFTLPFFLLSKEILPQHGLSISIVNFVPRRYSCAAKGENKATSLGGIIGAHDFLPTISNFRGESMRRKRCVWRQYMGTWSMDWFICRMQADSQRLPSACCSQLLPMRLKSDFDERFGWKRP